MLLFLNFYKKLKRYRLLPVFQTSNLKKVYRTEEVETTALDNVNLNVNEGEFVAIMGPAAIRVYEMFLAK